MYPIIEAKLTEGHFENFWGIYIDGELIHDLYCFYYVEQRGDLINLILTAWLNYATNWIDYYSLNNLPFNI